MSVFFKTKTIINPKTKNKQTKQGTTRVLKIKKKSDPRVYTILHKKQKNKNQS